MLTLDNIKLIDGETDEAQPNIVCDKVIEIDRSPSMVACYSPKHKKVHLSLGKHWSRVHRIV